MTTRTTTIAAREAVQRAWHLVDAEGQTLGRLATKVASLLMGKHKPTLNTHNDQGDHVIIVNAEKVKFTGQKLDKKTYIHHTQYPGGLKEESARKRMARKPVFAVEAAVRGMLPKTKLGDKMYTKLQVYAGADHPHKAQKPTVVQLTKSK